MGLAAAPRRARVSGVIGVRPGAVTPVLSHEQEDYFRPIRGDCVLQIISGCDCFALCRVGSADAGTLIRVGLLRTAAFF